MLKRYEEVKAIYELAKYSNPENKEVVKEDPIILAFEEKINEDSVDGQYITVFDYYDNIENKILVREMYENSKKVLECYNFIISVEGYEATVEFWEANADFIAPYASVIRDIVNPGLYDATLDGIDAAVAEFRKLDVYYYELLQKQHIAYIKAQLEKYEATSAYIDKSGICTGLLSYVAPEGENNLAVYLSIDENGNSVFTENSYITYEVLQVIRDEMKELEQLEISIFVHNEELALQVDDYIDVLESNTANFMGIVKHMQTAVTYAEIKPLFDQATVYYYAINIKPFDS